MISMQIDLGWFRVLYISNLIMFWRSIMKLQFPYATIIYETIEVMHRCQNIRLRCAFRYLYCVALITTLFISMKITFRQDRCTMNLKTSLLLNMSELERNSFINKFRHRNYPKSVEKLELSREHFKSSDENNAGFRIKIVWDEYKNSPNSKSGNPLIDNYGKNVPIIMGENGSDVLLVGKEKDRAKALMDKYNINVYLSDKIALNRMVPDARFNGCEGISFPEELPTASIIIPFYDEWPSILLRTIYSIINRTPKKLLKEIILVDDCSQMEELKSNLDNYIDTDFPRGLVKLIRLTERKGLIQARLAGLRNSTGDVIVIFDSHMEVNIDWLQPLLAEIKKDRKIIALANLDYVQRDTLEYKYHEHHITRYGFDWRLVFYEIFFREYFTGYQASASPSDAKPAVVMVGAGFAVDRDYFHDIGAYDEEMKIWGGENLELSWRIWLCGGRLLHVPCSHIGHIARGQPYTFVEGRQAVELFNYKRAVKVWMEPEHKELVYNHFQDMKGQTAGVYQTDTIEEKRT